MRSRALPACTSVPRADNVAKASRITFLVEDLAALKASNPTAQVSARLQKKIDNMGVRREELEAQYAALRHKLATAEKALEALSAEP